MEHYRTRFNDVETILRDMEERDIPRIVSYWSGSPPEYMRSIGIDVRKLTSPDEMAERWRALIAPAGPRNLACLVAESGGRLLGYTLLRRSDEKQGYIHAHILDEDLRSHGLASLMLVEVFRVFFRSFPIDEILMATAPENKRINGLLQKFGLVPVQAEMAAPEGKMRPGLVNIYTLPRALAESLSSARDKS